MLGVGSEGWPPEALRRGGKFRKLDDGLEVKEVVVNAGNPARRRFAVVRKPGGAEQPVSRRDVGERRGHNATGHAEGSIMPAVITSHYSRKQEVEMNVSRPSITGDMGTLSDVNSIPRLICHPNPTQPSAAGAKRPEAMLRSGD